MPRPSCTCMPCCRACKPRYKRFVDGIYPTDRSQESIDRNNMQKLTYFAMSHPQKLDRIGQYLEQKMSGDIYRRRIRNVHVAMQALDELLLACHYQTLNLFVESFLRMVQKLLECQEFDLQELATNSFVKFSNIHEDTASYHRRYDFFVSRFSSMCHTNCDDKATRVKMRLAGLRGIQGVVRKTASDDLQVNIWEASHMEKIVPSLLFNMQSSSNDIDLNDLSQTHDITDVPAELAESCLRDLVCRAAYGNLTSVIRPALKHFDLHELWVPNDFAVRCFKIIMYSVNSQYALMVIEMLQKHLNERSNDDPTIKTSIVIVLSEVVTIAAQASIGLSVLDFFNTMLRHLKQSIASKPQDEEDAADARQFQEAIISLCGEFAGNMPDFQKIDICMFIMSAMPSTKRKQLQRVEDKVMQNMLLRCILQVATEYKTVHLSAAFPSAFLHPLLKLSVVDDPEVRLVVLNIFHTLFDRKENLERIKKLRIQEKFEDLGLVIEKCSRQDIVFMKKNEIDILSNLYSYVEHDNNGRENLEALASLLIILLLEMNGSDFGIELMRLVFALQDMACDITAPLHDSTRCAIHATVAIYLYISSNISDIDAFREQITQVIDKRRELMPELLPESVFTATGYNSLHYDGENVNKDLLFDRSLICEALKEVDSDASVRLSLSFIARSLDSGDNRSRKESVSGTSLSQIELESANSSPAITRRASSAEMIHARELKELINKDSLMYKRRMEKDEQYRNEILVMFRTASFHELRQFVEKKSNYNDQKLEELLQSLAADLEDSSDSDDKHDGKRKSHTSKLFPPTNQPVSIFEMKYPDLFVF